MAECIHRGLFGVYEEEKEESLNTAQVPWYSIQRVDFLAEALRAKELIDPNFFNNYMSNLHWLNKHPKREDEPAW